MLEDFENLDNDLQKHLIGVCKPATVAYTLLKAAGIKFSQSKLNMMEKNITFAPTIFPVMTGKQ